jgi:hypothetical protein
MAEMVTTKETIAAASIAREAERAQHKKDKKIEKDYRGHRTKDLCERRTQILIGQILFESSGKLVLQNENGSVDPAPLSLETLLPNLDPMDFVAGVFEVFVKPVPRPHYKRVKARRQKLEEQRGVSTVTAQPNTPVE